MSPKWPEVNRYATYFCGPCIGGQGGECHTPGCFLYLKSVEQPVMTPLLTALPPETLQPSGGLVEILTTGHTTLVCEDAAPLDHIIEKAYSAARLHSTPGMAQKIADERLGDVVIRDSDGLKYRLRIRVSHEWLPMSPDDERQLRERVRVCADHMREFCEPCEEKEDD